MLLYVGRLPLSYFGYRELEIIFRKYGTITDSSMFSGDRYGFGFVNFKNPEDAHDAVCNEHGRYIDGTRIIVERVPDMNIVVCYQCGRQGHKSRDCWNDRDVNKQSHSFSKNEDNFKHGESERSCVDYQSSDRVGGGEEDRSTQRYPLQSYSDIGRRNNREEGRYYPRSRSPRYRHSRSKENYQHRCSRSPPTESRSRNVRDLRDESYRRR